MLKTVKVDEKPAIPVASLAHPPHPPNAFTRRSSLSLSLNPKQAENKEVVIERRASLVQLEEAQRGAIAAVKMEARKRRLLTSADAMFQQRECFSGVVEGKFKFEQANPALLHMMQADVFKGMWSCCRKINANDIGCTKSVGHNIQKPRCAQCGQYFNFESGKHKGYTADKDEACLYHPGTLETSRFGGTIWTCCRSSGYEDSSLDQKQLEGEYRWGCQRGPHLAMKFPKMDRSKVLDALSVQVIQASLQGNRTTGVSCFTRLRYNESEFTTKRSYDSMSPRWEGLDKPFHIKLEPTNAAAHQITFELTDVFHNDAQKEVLATAIFFPKLEYDRDAESQSEEIWLELKFASGARRSLKMKGKLQIRLFPFFCDRWKCACLECGTNFDHIGNEFTLENAISRFKQQLCILHPGTYCKDRQSREKGGTRCTGICTRPHCGNQCARTPHSRNPRVDQIGCICASKTCSYPCHVKGCMNRCSVRDHFHEGLHDCGEDFHMCYQTCSAVGCDRLCARDARLPHICSCEDRDEGLQVEPGSKLDRKLQLLGMMFIKVPAQGCTHTCEVPGCDELCGSGGSHHGQHEMMTSNFRHHCRRYHACDNRCTAAACSRKCVLPKDDGHGDAHSCDQKEGCGCKCTVSGCVNTCSNRNHFHGNFSKNHHCSEDHPCRHKCSAPGCLQTCKIQRDEHEEDGRHDCGYFQCLLPCDMPGCKELCDVKDHHASKHTRHLCHKLKHACPETCSALGCANQCGQTLEDDKTHTASSRHCCRDSSKGCVASCSMPSCSEQCSHFDHFHSNQADAMHQCPGRHICHEVCDLCRTGRQAGKYGAKFAKVVCGMDIMPGMRRHEGMHVCRGEHVAEKECIGRCANKCTIATCDLRCIMVANSDWKSNHENCFCSEHAVCGGKCERRVECSRPCMKPAWHMKGHSVFPLCLPKSSTFFTICDCLEKHEKPTSLDRKAKKGKLSKRQGNQDPRKRAQQVFDQFDKDHSGSIEFEELLEVLALMETAVSEEEAVRIMQVADKDGSGQISFDEFCEVIGLGSSESDNSWKGMLGDLHLGTQGVGEGTGVGGCNVGMGIGHIRHLARVFGQGPRPALPETENLMMTGRKPKKESDVQISAREENEAKSMMISSRWIHLSSRLKKWLRRLKLNKKNHKFPEQQPAQPNVMAAEPTPKKSRDVKLFRLSVSSRVMISDSPSLEKQNDRRSITVDHSEEQEKNMESHRLLKFISGDINKEGNSKAKWSREQSSILPHYLPSSERAHTRPSTHLSMLVEPEGKQEVKQEQHIARQQEESTRRIHKPRRPEIRWTTDSNLKVMRKKFLFDSFLAEFQEAFENLDGARK